MFKTGFEKVAVGGIKPLKMMKPHASIDPISTRDALGASTRAVFSRPISNFGNRPRQALKALSQVRHAANRI